MKMEDGSVKPKFLLYFILLSICFACLGTPTSTVIPVTTVPLMTPTIIPEPTEQVALDTTSPTVTQDIPKGAGMAMKVAIRETDQVIYRFVPDYCSATWVNSAMSLPCPGDPTSLDGSVILVDRPTLTGNVMIANQALQVIPGTGPNGAGLFGKYPPIQIETGMRFIAAIACQTEPCYADFSLSCYDEPGSYYDFAGWQIRPGQSWVDIDVDLSPILGQTVNFELAIRNEAKEHYADHTVGLWVDPVIVIRTE